jgi:ATP-dependent protease ClpP protease subunit
MPSVDADIDRDTILTGPDALAYGLAEHMARRDRRFRTSFFTIGSVFIL